MAVQNIIIDFEVLNTGNPQTLIVCDTSEYGQVYNKAAIIEIVLPSGDKVTHYVSKNNNNVFNSSNLYLSNVGQYINLPDGLYTISIKASPDTFNKTRTYLKTDSLELNIAEAFSSVGMDIKEELLNYLIKVEFFIKAAKAAVRLGQNKKAISYYNLAKSLHDEYINCSSC